MMISADEITKRVIDFQKGAFSTWYGAMATLQDQAASAMDLLLNQSYLVPEEGRRTISNWVDACQQERNRFKAFVEEGFSSLENYGSQNQKPTATEARKAAPAKPKASAAPAAKTTVPADM